MQGLIIAAIIVAFLFNVYKNFKKEMEKAKARGNDAEAVAQAKERAEALERKQKAVYRPVVAQQNQTAYDKAAAEDYTAAEPAYESNRDGYYRAQAEKKEIRAAKSTRKIPVADYYNPEVPSLEVLENRRIHQPHKHGYTPPKLNEKHLAADFNFKQALIYDAILRRPEY